MVTVENLESDQPLAYSLPPLPSNVRQCSWYSIFKITIIADTCIGIVSPINVC